MRATADKNTFIQERNSKTLGHGSSKYGGKYSWAKTMLIIKKKW